MPRSTIRAVPEIDFVSRRSDMVEHQIAARGVRSKLVLEAMRKVPREEFLAAVVARICLRGLAAAHC